MRPEEIAARAREVAGAAVEHALAPAAHLGPSPRVVAAMSGGVDSAVAAALLRGAGYDVIGVSMRLGTSAARADGHAGCCSLDDFDDARRAARLLDVPHYVVDLRDVFQASVVEPFTATYLRGRTPNPCTLCNRDVKFDALWRYARTFGAAAIGTGHYARIGGDAASGFALHAAADPAKDQSYFLFTLGQEELARTLFPVGALTKPVVRALAAALALPVADKPESQDICFVAGRTYADFVESRTGAAEHRPGRIVDGAGRVLGRHAGVHRFTVGQRRGIGGGAATPRYVTAIDAATGDVRVGGRDELAATGFVARDVRWTRAPHRGPARVRLRHRHPPVACEVVPRAGEAWVRFPEPTVGVTPGQAAVWYDGDRVLGGGWIEERL
ncbi:MAG: tRNA 2-thiouridine(34) synthase MnmA [Thermodesulfobacteriota bacterium]